MKLTPLLDLAVFSTSLCLTRHTCVSFRSTTFVCIAYSFLCLSILFVSHSQLQILAGAGLTQAPLTIIQGGGKYLNCTFFLVNI